jgi:signal peptidase I
MFSPKYAIVPAPAGQTYEITLQAGEYFVLGDDRPNSNDSRRMGPIQADLIIGRVKITAWNRLFNRGPD